MRIAILKSMSTFALSLLLAGAAHAQVKLAVAGPVTGPNAAFGAQLTQGVQQAAEPGSRLRAKRRSRGAVPGSADPPTATGLPRSSGLSRCSTEAENASMSMWMILR